MCYPITFALIEVFFFTTFKYLKLKVQRTIRIPIILKIMILVSPKTQFFSMLAFALAQPRGLTNIALIVRQASNLINAAIH